ncbi:MAG: TerB N-terminal domain-containing protein [Lachnospiraceae bacterium]|nr:TerB N-terminal domain-containing protein [Lachnospiraceae bacterium]
MEIRELTAYAEEKYHMAEEYKWASFPGFSVIPHPRSGKWIALFMRQWDQETGTQIECCDLKCGQECLKTVQAPYLSLPIRMKGTEWINVRFEKETDPETVFRLFDRAVSLGEKTGFTIVLDNTSPVRDKAGQQDSRDKVSGTVYQDTAIPAPGTFSRGSGAGSYNNSGNNTQSNNTQNNNTQNSNPRNNTSGNKNADKKGVDIHVNKVIDTDIVDTIIRDTVIPAIGGLIKKGRVFFREKQENARRQALPERLRQLRRLYHYGPETREEKARNFYHQAVFMKDFEDDAPWPGDFYSYLPTYQDMTTNQLRGYFSWRTQVRKGEYRRIAPSAFYVYLYELLNGIGAEPGQDVLNKMEAFEKGYLDAGIIKGNIAGDDYLISKYKKDLKKWMLEYAVIRELPAETAVRYEEPEQRERDEALAVLRAPDQFPDETVFDALMCFSDRRLLQSPVLKADEVRGKHLFSQAWRHAKAEYGEGQNDLFERCFGKAGKRSWYPLSSTLYYMQEKPKDQEYQLNAARRYVCRKGFWQEESYEKTFFDRDFFRGFMRETDRMLRQYLKTGRYLKEKPEDKWARPFLEKVIEEDKQDILEASRKKIVINFENLDRIREESLITRDSLLVEEPEERSGTDAGAYAGSMDNNPEASAAAGAAKSTEAAGAARSEEDSEENPLLSSLQARILRMLLDGEDEAAVTRLIREEHSMPSLEADRINEALYDEIGDIVVWAEDDRLVLEDTYREDLERLL